MIAAEEETPVAPAAALPKNATDLQVPAFYSAAGLLLAIDWLVSDLGSFEAMVAWLAAAIAMAVPLAFARYFGMVLRQVCAIVTTAGLGAAAWYGLATIPPGQIAFPHIAAVLIVLLASRRLSRLSGGGWLPLLVPITSLKLTFDLSFAIESIHFEFISILALCVLIGFATLLVGALHFANHPPETEAQAGIQEGVLLSAAASIAIPGISWWFITTPAIGEVDWLLVTWMAFTTLVVFAACLTFGRRAVFVEWLIMMMGVHLLFWWWAEQDAYSKIAGVYLLVVVLAYLGWVSLTNALAPLTSTVTQLFKRRSTPAA